MKFNKKTRLYTAISAALALTFCSGTILVKAYAIDNKSINSTVIELATKIQSGDKSTKTNSYDKEYAEWGIEKIDDAYYYNNEHVRIFMDLRADNSFVTFNYDEKYGTVDLKVERNENDDIILVSYVKKEEVNKILEDIDDSYSNIESQQDIIEKETKATEDIKRLILEKAPVNIQETIKSLEDNKWYVIESDGRQYVYYNNLPHNYAYQYEQDKNNLIIVDIGKSTDNYVLLSIPQGSTLTITYNSQQIVYTKTVL